MKPTGAHDSPVTDEDRARSFHESKLFAGASSALGSVSILFAHVWRAPQVASNCVAYALVTLVHLLAALQGQPLSELLSTMLPYSLGRIRAGQLVSGVGIPDNGSNCGAVLASMRDHVMVSETVYPDVVENVTRVPPADVWQDAGLAQITTAHRIIFEASAGVEDPVGTFRRLAVAALNAANAKQASPPCVCMTVDDAYYAVGQTASDVTAYYAARANWLIYSGPGGKVWGRHCQAIIDYDEATDTFGLASSWDEGIVFRVTATWLALNGDGSFVIEGIRRIAA